MKIFSDEQEKVSVIMPTFNQGEFIGEGIQSVLNQGYRNFELIIIDNYSSDSTEDVVKSFRHRDDRIKYEKISNNGIIATSRNLGIKLATGKYVAFIDSDDIWLPGKIQGQTNAFLRDPKLALVYTNTESFGEKSASAGFRVNGCRGAIQFSDLLKHNTITCSSVMMKKEALGCVGLFSEKRELRTVEDWELWLRTSYRYPVGFITKVYVRYRVHPEGCSREKSPETLTKYLRVLEKIFAECAVSQSVQAATLSHWYSIIGRMFLKQGKYDMFEYYTKEAIRQQRNVNSAALILLYRLPQGWRLARMMSELESFLSKSVLKSRCLKWIRP